MDIIVGKLDLILIIVGSLLGSVKANLEFEKNQHCVARALDIALGVFVGTAIAYHYGSGWSMWLEGLVALIGGVSGTMVVEVFLQMLPSLTRQLVKRIFQDKLP